MQVLVSGASPVGRCLLAGCIPVVACVCVCLSALPKAV